MTKLMGTVKDYQFITMLSRYYRVESYNVARSSVKGPYPLGDINVITDAIADHPVGMAYLLGDWATDHRVTAVTWRREDHRLISSMFDISLPTSRPSMADARQQSHPVGMALKELFETSPSTSI